MSRIGKLPIHIPQGVTVAVSPDNTVTVKGPKGQLSQKVSSDLTVAVEGKQSTTWFIPGIDSQYGGWCF